MCKVIAGSAYLNMRLTRGSVFNRFHRCRVDRQKRCKNDRVDANILIRFRFNENGDI